MHNSFFNPINELLKGLRTVLKNGLKKRVTLEYPEKKKVLNENFRGKILYDKTKCAKCKLCQKVCPVKNNIIITEDEFIINHSSCIFCGNCVEICSKQALTFSKDYELATTKKQNLITKEDIQ